MYIARMVGVCDNTLTPLFFADTIKGILVEVVDASR
jgi:hypothetical protein